MRPPRACPPAADHAQAGLDNPGWSWTLQDPTHASTWKSGSVRMRSHAPRPCFCTPDRRAVSSAASHTLYSLHTRQRGNKQGFGGQPAKRVLCAVPGMDWLHRGYWAVAAACTAMTLPLTTAGRLDSSGSGGPTHLALPLPMGKGLSPVPAAAESQEVLRDTWRASYVQPVGNLWAIWSVTAAFFSASGSPPIALHDIIERLQVSLVLSPFAFGTTT